MNPKHIVSLLLEGAPLTRQQITAAVQDTLRDYIARGEVKCAYDVGDGACEDFAEDVVAGLGNPDELDAIEYANLTGPHESGETSTSLVYADERFYPETMVAFDVKIPEGVTIDALNNCGLGQVGTHVFIRWKSPQGFLYFDAEAPQGVDSPFSLPFAQRYLKQPKR